MTCINSQERLDQIRQLIDVYFDAILQLGTNGVQSYELDTGQTKQKVTKFDLPKLREILDGLCNQEAIWCQRINGSGTMVSRGAW